MRTYDVVDFIFHRFIVVSAAWFGQLPKGTSALGLSEYYDHIDSD